MSINVRADRVGLEKDEILKIYTTCSLAGIRNIQIDPYLSKYGGKEIGENPDAVLRLPITELESDGGATYSMLNGMWNGSLAIVDRRGGCYILKSIRGYAIRKIQKDIQSWLKYTYPTISLHPYINYMYFSVTSDECSHIDHLIGSLPNLAKNRNNDDWEIVMVYNGEKNYFQLVEVSRFGNEGS